MPRPSPPPALRRVVLYVAEDCHLCELALEAVTRVRAETPFALETVDIGGDPELESRYRVLLPVLELDGEPVFTFEVDEDGLRELLAACPS